MLRLSWKTAARSALIGLVPLLLTLPAGTARADGLIRQLPPDGSQAEYHFTLKVGSTESTGTVVLRSVGSTTEKGQPARWIELDSKPSNGSTGEPTVYKLLVPEKHIRSGVDPLDHVIRAWQKKGDGAPERLEDVQQLDRGLVGALLHGPVEKEQSLGQKRSFAYQDGTLECEGIVGDREFDLGNVQGTLHSTMWAHKKVPFGVAGLMVELELSGSKASMELLVNDFGGGAQSVLPDAR